MYAELDYRDSVSLIYVYDDALLAYNGFEFTYDLLSVFPIADFFTRNGGKYGTTTGK